MPPTRAASSRCRPMAPACWARSTSRAWCEQPFTPQAHLNEAELVRLVAIAVRMMDNTIDASGFPLEAQAREAQAKRRIGLGMTGLADALMMVGLRYGSEQAAARAEHWAGLISRAAYLTSADLARGEGGVSAVRPGRLPRRRDDPRRWMRMSGRRSPRRASGMRC